MKLLRILDILVRIPSLMLVVAGVGKWKRQKDFRLSIEQSGYSRRESSIIRSTVIPFELSLGIWGLLTKKSGGHSLVLQSLVSVSSLGMFTGYLKAASKQSSDWRCDCFGGQMPFLNNRASQGIRRNYMMIVLVISRLGLAYVRIWPRFRLLQGVLALCSVAVASGWISFALTSARIRRADGETEDIQGNLVNYSQLTLDGDRLHKLLPDLPMSTTYLLLLPDGCPACLDLLVETDTLNLITSGMVILLLGKEQSTRLSSPGSLVIPDDDWEMEFASLFQLVGVPALCAVDVKSATSGARIVGVPAITQHIDMLKSGVGTTQLAH